MTTTVPDRTLLTIRALLVLAALTPLVYGGALVIDPHLATFIVARVSDGVLQVDPALAYVNRVLGVYIFLVGVLLIVCLRDPRRMSPAIAWAGALLAVRGLQRLVFIPELEATFDIPAWRNVAAGGFTLTLGLALLVLRPRRERHVHNTTTDHGRGVTSST
jgi:hypothetical protein